MILARIAAEFVSVIAPLVTVTAPEIVGVPEIATVPEMGCVTPEPSTFSRSVASADGSRSRIASDTVLSAESVTSSAKPMGKSTVRRMG